jgi:hypothetical protein
MKIIDYKLIFHRADYVENEVKTLLGQGWQPLGAPVVSPAPPHSDQTDTVYQAMVLHAGAKSQAE